MSEGAHDVAEEDRKGMAQRAKLRALAKRGRVLRGVRWVGERNMENASRTSNHLSIHICVNLLLIRMAKDDSNEARGS